MISLQKTEAVTLSAAQGALRHSLLPEQPMVQHQSEVRVLESPPVAAMETQSFTTKQRSMWRRASSWTAAFMSEAGLKKPLLRLE